MVSDRTKTRRASARPAKARTLSSLFSVGPATLRDFDQLGIRSVAELARQDPHRLYERLCVVTQTRQDPCCEDVFAAAIAQARDPHLPAPMCRWWYWSALRKANRVKTAACARARSSRGSRC